jgi:hypothetical protein
MSLQLTTVQALRLQRNLSCFLCLWRAPRSHIHIIVWTDRSLERASTWCLVTHNPFSTVSLASKSLAKLSLSFYWGLACCLRPVIQGSRSSWPAWYPNNWPLGAWIADVVCHVLCLQNTNLETDRSSSTGNGIKLRLSIWNGGFKKSDVICEIQVTDPCCWTPTGLSGVGDKAWLVFAHCSCQQVVDHDDKEEWTKVVSLEYSCGDMEGVRYSLTMTALLELSYNTQIALNVVSGIP